ncbi:hypothetical protein EZ428_12290 [Pedobacter frigiditerrae]|uniref:Uncharacterized protein n=1 Tax=Pedobacter frigiditerrae TaxID=2530452 RepID=A0A4R0MV40_9SPHI|nr:hypothetical protein [Pedobacter frigiditerrae]TCC90062.1 hypothetical protein EZ428_12290 [Pedobacter frigiditerrae]
MSQFLTKPIADAVCTAIVLGYASKNSNTIFQYMSAVDEKDSYDKVKVVFEKLGVNVSVSQSATVQEFGYIIATTPRASTIPAIAAMTDQYSNYIKRLTDAANAAAPPPYGAYIGGMSTVNQCFIVGPSNLELYKPAYRAPDQQVAEAYGKAVEFTNSALTAIETIGKPLPIKGYNINLVNTIPKISQKYVVGQLFKSYHGMIQAMSLYSTTIDNNSFIFEIALGKNTQKVSACFPCCAFMTANGKPPTSTHLGKGDNWGIPKSSNMMLQQAWAAKIKEWYLAGKQLMMAKEQLKNTFVEFGKENRENDIPGIFLEALTFEGKFTDRINNTLLGKV